MIALFAVDGREGVFDDMQPKKQKGARPVGLAPVKEGETLG